MITTRTLRGFTLIELMFTVVVFCMVGVVLIEGFVFLHRVGRAVQDKTDIHHMARMTFLTLSRDVRAATSVLLDTNTQNQVTLIEADGMKIDYRQDGKRILRTDAQGVRTLAEGISAIRVTSPATNNRLLHVVIESTETRKGHVLTNSVSLDLARRNGGTP